MKKLLLILFSLSSLLLSAEQKSIMVVSDMHVLDTLLFDQNDPSILYGDHKLVEHSAELWDSAVARIVAARPDILLVTGDLSYNGERLSHQYVARGLDKIRQAGVLVYVIPGNHDVSDPSARDYTTHTGVRTENLSAEGFAELYSPYGYGDAVVRLDNETDSLSYMAYPTDDIAIIAINTSQSNLQAHKSAGGITEGAMQFIRTCAERAISEGHHNLLLMTHHPIMQHCDGQTRIDASHIGNLSYGITPQEDLHKALTDAHIHAVFSGHAHIHSIAHVSTEQGALYDIVTGSLSSYPSPMHICTLDTETGELQIAGTEIPRYQEEAYQRDSVLAKGAVNAITEMIYPRFAQIQERINNNFALKKVFGNMFGNVDKEGLKELVWMSMGQELQHALCAFSRGDEAEYFPTDSAYNAAIDAYHNMLTLFFGMDMSKAMGLLEKFNILPDFGFSPEELFGSIYGNYVTIDEEQILTPDASCTVLDEVVVSEGKPQPTGLDDAQTMQSVSIKRLENNRIVIYLQDRRFNLTGQAE